MEPASSENKVVLSLDIGTTSVRCGLVDHTGKLVMPPRVQSVTLTQSHGLSEMDPEEVFDAVVTLMKQTIQEANVRPSVRDRFLYDDE
jgi:gluconokinase